MSIGANAAVQEQSLSEQDWARLLDRIEARSVIPVVGEQLTLLQRGEPPTEHSLSSYLASEFKQDGPHPTSLNEFALRYLKTHPRGGEDLYTDIFRALPVATPFAIPKPLRQLAEIRHFDIFINTSFDPYLTLALNEVRFGRRSSLSTRVLSYEGSREVDLPAGYSSLDHPLVYHLFGKLQAAPLYAVTDEDVLELVHALQSPECMPVHLAEALQKQRLLVIGTRLSGWLARFFLRISSKDRLRDARRADYLVDLSISSDPDQTLFFENFGQVKLLPMSAVRFVEELSMRWKVRHPELQFAGTTTSGKSIPPGAPEVFLSYASEDLAFVKLLRERLEREAGVRVWLDRDSLRGGDRWETRIADTLRSCAVCVPVISSNAARGTYRYVRSEWNEAFRAQSGRHPEARYIIPLAVGDIGSDDLAIMPELRALNWRRADNDGDMKCFLDEVRAEVQRERNV